MITAISETDALSKVQDVLLSLAIQEGFITEESLAIDAMYFEALDKPEAAVKKEKSASKKRGPKPKNERDAWQAAQQKQEAEKTLYEKKLSINCMPPSRRW